MSSEAAYRHNITGVVLCGGEGRRVGGRDKPLIEFEGRRLVEYVIEAMSPCVGRLMISCNRSQAIYEQYGYRLVVDRNPFNGPLEGIAAALRACETPWLLVAPGDCPRVTRELFERLLESPGLARIRVAHDGTRRQPLFCLVPRSMADVVSRATRGGPAAVGQFLDQCDVEELDCTDIADVFTNVNAAEQFRT